jgi:protein-tyrosine phosphatase
MLGKPAVRMITLSKTEKVINHFTNLTLEPTEIIPGIYLGNAYNANNFAILSKLNIKVIVNVSTEFNNTYEKDTDIKYIQIPIRDDADHHLNKHSIKQVFEFLDLYAPYDENNAVLFHCYMGSSRSASITLAYLIHHYKYNFTDALSLVKERRNIVNINVNFLNDIRNYFDDDPVII